MDCEKIEQKGWMTDTWISMCRHNLAAMYISQFIICKQKKITITYSYIIKI